jgi:hypothetical protein
MIVGMIIIGAGGSPLSIILRSFYRQRVCVNDSSKSSGLHYFASDNCSTMRDPLLGLVSFQGFHPISLHYLLRATGDDGFRSYVS